ncbi:protein kinase [Singulisphaera sp. Ch08]|uniref:Protein kinase n=1 Tax=Singulisphaera sp. Ch08 TaxID=3120278 RepID=A0AAU7CB84_9BACT
MDDSATLPGRTWDEFEDVIRRFEDAWQGPARPEILAYLPTGTDRTRLLTELVHVDLEYRLRAGESARVEEYLARYPEFIDDREVMLELIAAEHEFRRRREPSLALSEFLQRFPEYRAELPGRITQATIDGRDVRLRPTDQRAEALPEVPGYEILGLLGRGGMGVVYRARQLGLGRIVALKMILTGFQAGPKDLARFRAEAAALARLQHPNIVQIYDVGETGSRPYFVFEFVAGGSLAQYLQSTPQPVRPAAQLVETLARAVHIAHANGVIHRDLKPANILLRDERADARGKSREVGPLTPRLASLVPKITDFGLAKCDGGDGEAPGLRGHTVTGDLLGTPNYMAPEQAMVPRQPVGPAADVYALGAILYELLTGRPPFTGETPLATVLQVLNNEPVPVTSLRPDVPRDLETICIKCLRKEPRQRYGSALELAEDLRHFLRDEPIRARPVSAVEKLGRWVRRRPAAAGLLAAGLLAPAVALIAMSLLSARLVRSNALDSAAQQAELLEEATKEYSRNVQHVEKAGFTVNKTVPPTPGTVPLSIPATYLHDVGQQLGLTGRTGVKVRQYSDYPFPWRTDGGPRDEFERKALRRLRQSKGRETVHEFTEVGGRRVVRYAQARIMERSCVQCHSTHDQSPRKDWRVGDVRGVLEIIRPLDKDEARVSEALRLALLLSAVVSGLLLGGSMLMVWVGRRRTSVGS